MDNTDDSAEDQEGEIFGVPSPSSSYSAALGLSLGASQDFRQALGSSLGGSGSSLGASGASLGASQDFRQALKPPNKKKYDEELERLMQEIKVKDTELKSLGGRSPDGQGPSVSLDSLRAEKDANISKRKKVDAELKQLNLDIQKLRGGLSTTESNLHYKNEVKIDEAIRKLEYQLKVQNFKLSEERKIVAEIDKLKRSKKVLVQYFSQKQKLDEARAKQNRLRGEREYFYKSVTTLKTREDDIRRSRQVNRTRAEELKKEMKDLYNCKSKLFADYKQHGMDFSRLQEEHKKVQEINDLYNSKRKLFADFKQHETDYNRLQKEHKKVQRKESIRKREEEKRAKEMAYRKEMLEFEAQKEPFEDEKNLCNTLMSYLQRYTTTSGEGSDLASPREEQPDTSPMGSNVPSIADSLDDGKFVLLKKSDDTELDYSISNKRPSSRRGKKSRKTSVTKPLAHTPQIIAQFASLNLNAPSNMSEIAASLEQLQARKKYYDEHAATVPRPPLGSLTGSFSSSGSMSSLESPLRERSSTWGFVEVPPVIMENQTLSDCGRSAESGFHDMSRQASKTESSESAADAQPLDHALDEIIQQSAEYDESEHSRSSSDTVTADDHMTDHVIEDCENVKDTMVTSPQETGTRHSLFKNINQSKSHDRNESQTDSHDNDSAVFEMSTEENKPEKSSRPKTLKPQSSYDRDFPAALTVNYMPKEKAQTFQNKPTMTDIEDNDKILPSNTLLPSNNSVKTLPINQKDDQQLPSNTDSVQMDNKHPGDADCYSDACQASNDHVPNLDTNETNIVPKTNTDNDIVPVTESDISDDVLHIGSQTTNKPQTSATVSDPETETICKPKVLDNCEPLLPICSYPEPPVANSSIDSSDSGDINSRVTTHTSDSNCDKNTSADDPQLCDASLEKVDVHTDSVGMDCTEKAEIGPVLGAGEDAESQRDIEGAKNREGVEDGTVLEGVSGFEDSLGASGIVGDTENSAQENTKL